VREYCEKKERKGKEKENWRETMRGHKEMGMMMTVVIVNMIRILSDATESIPKISSAIGVKKSKGFKNQ
jgi:hypothetical protein